MSLSANTMKWSITCSGDKTVDIVTLDQQLYDDDDIEVILETTATGAETTLVKTTDYAVGNVPSAAATVTTVSDYSSAYQLHVRRVAILKQTTDFVSGDSFPDAVVEKIMDKLVMDTQVNNDGMRRAVKWSKTSALRDLELADPAQNGGKLLAVNAGGTGLSYVDNDATNTDADLADLLSSSGFGTKIYPQEVQVGSTGIRVISGSGTPETNVVGDVGSIYLRTDGGAGTSVYFKESGTGNTGWVAANIQSPASWPSFLAHRNGTTQDNITGIDLLDFNDDSTSPGFDTNSDFDTSTSRFTPTVAGKYLLMLRAEWANVTVGDNLILYIYKNGAQLIVESLLAPGSGSVDESISIIAEANGTTDYFEAFAQNIDRDTADMSGFSSKSSFTGSRIA